MTNDLSPVAEVLGLILKSQDSRSSQRWRIFSYRRDFDFLWGLGQHVNKGFISESGEPESILLIWDGLPEHPTETTPVNVGGRVTAYDWLAFLIICLAGTSRGIRVVVFDLCSDAHATSFGCRLFPLLLPLVPWIWIVPGGGTDTSSASRFLHEFLTDQLAHPFLSPGEHGIGGVAVQFRELWSSDITRAGGRHEISNLVAPFVLGDGLVNTNAEGAADLMAELHKGNLRSALVTLLRRLGLLQPPALLLATGNSTAPTLCLLKSGDEFVRQGRRDIFDRFSNVRAVLIDDQFRLGYHDVLCTLLFGRVLTKKPVIDGVISIDQSASLESISKADRLLDTLDASFTDRVDWEMPRELGTTGALRYDLMFLDLRLFSASHSDTPSTAELVFFERVLALFKRTGAMKVTDVGLHAAHDAAMRRWNDGAGGAEEPLALALLPSLLSHLDPSLPIVLFSSTHQRAILQALRDRPNIITSFSKPIISGYVEHDHGAQSLTDAVQRALDLHEMRVVWKALCGSDDWGQYPAFEMSRMTDYIVFNEPTEDTIPDRKRGNQSLPRRRHSGVLVPHLTKAPLIRRLREYYCRYLVRGLLFDLISLPFEFLEGVLRIPALDADPMITDFTISFSSYNLDVPNNSICQAFRDIRNRKAHGQTAYEVLPEWDYYQPIKGKVVVALFLMWLDFIFRTGEPRDLHDWKSLEQKAKELLGHCYPMAGTAALDLSRTGDDTTVNWEHFAVYAMVTACREVAENAYEAERKAGRSGAPRPRGNVVSRRVEIALQKLVKLMSA